MPWRCKQRGNDERQLRDFGLLGVKAVVQPQKCVTAESDDARLLFDRKRCRMRLLWTGRQILYRRPLLPLGHGLLIDAVALGEIPSGSLNYVVSLDVLPLSSWRSRVESDPQRILPFLSE